MAKLYKVRKKCMICGGVFYPKYAGSLYCEICKSKKAESAPAVKVAKPVKKQVKKIAAKKLVKKAAQKALGKKPAASKSAKKATRSVKKARK